MTKYITCQKDMSEVPEWHCSNNCEDCVYYEFYKKGGKLEEVAKLMDEHRNLHRSTRKKRNSNRRRSS